VRRLTRRQAIAGGALLAAAGVVRWGPFALGGTFEDHVAEVLGVDGALAREMLARARADLGDYEARASAFVLATTTPSDLLMPSGLRREAMEAFVHPLLHPEEPNSPRLAYAGLRRTGEFAPCRGLVRS
jgi:hypothetical protein